MVSSSSIVERTEIIIKDVLPSSGGLQSTFLTVAAWPSVPMACGWLCRVTVVLLTHSRCHFPSPAAHTIAMLPFSFFFFAFYGLAEKMLHWHQCVQSAACRILSPFQGLSGWHCQSGRSRAGSLSNITLILKFL